MNRYARAPAVLAAGVLGTGTGSTGVVRQSIVVTEAVDGEPGELRQVPVSADVCRSTVTAKDALDCAPHADPASIAASAIAPAAHPLRHGAPMRPTVFADCIRNLPHAMVGDQYVTVKTRASVPEQEPSAQVPPWPEAIVPLIE
jgi:hypothetical protein